MCVVDTDIVGQLTIGAAAAAAAAAGRVQWDKMSVVAHQGDNVTLVCTVRAVDLFDVVRLTLTPSSDYVAALGLPRPEPESAAAHQRWPIADNDVVKPPFLALSRYGVTMTVNGRRAVIQLQVIGVSFFHPTHRVLRFTTGVAREAVGAIAPKNPKLLQIFFLFCPSPAGGAYSGPSGLRSALKTNACL